MGIGIQGLAHIRPELIRTFVLAQKLYQII
jgi:hypothetical protein